MTRARIVAVFTAGGFGICIWAVATAQEFSRNPRVNPSGYAAHPVGQATGRSVPQSTGRGDFNGKLVALTVRGSNQPKLLDKPQFQEIHGRRFLVGQEAKAAFSFPIGTPAHIAWDAVEAFYVFDSVDQYEGAMRQALRQAQGNLGQMLTEFFPGEQCSINGGPGFGNPITTDGSYFVPAQQKTSTIFPVGGGEARVEITVPNDGESPVPVAEPAPQRVYLPKRVYSRPATVAP